MKIVYWLNTGKIKKMKANKRLFQGAKAAQLIKKEDMGNVRPSNPKGRSSGQFQKLFRQKNEYN